MAKACLFFFAGPSTEFHDKMVRIFSIYRGHQRFAINTPTIKGFFQFDETVADGVFQELPDGYFIELGLNFSKSSIEERIEALRSEREEGLRRTLDGEVCQIFISKRSGNVIIATDPFGLLPLYYHRSPECAIISTDVKAILAVLPHLRTQLNRQSILEYISSHFILENRTLFDDVFLFPEGSISTFNIKIPDTWTSMEWVTLPQHYEDHDIDEWISRSAQLLERSMNKRLQSGSGVFLSGGMDSRVILAMIPKNVRSTMKALTFGVDGADDCRIAKRVAKRFGIELVHVILDTNIFMENFLEHMWLSDGVSNHMVAPIASAVKLLNAPRIFDGFAGDAQFGGGFHDHTMDLDSDRWPCPREQYMLDGVLSKRYVRPLWEVALLLRNVDEPQIRKTLLEGIKGEASRLPEGMIPSLQYALFLFRVRPKRNTMGGQLSADSVSLVMKPFYDLDFAETIMRIPARDRRNHLFHNRFVSRVVPSALKDPTTTIMPLDRKAKLTRFMKRVLRFVARKFGVELLPKRGWIPIDEWIRQNARYRTWMMSILLDERTRNRGIIDPDGVRQLVKQELRGDHNLAMTLVNAVDLELVLRLFSDGDGFQMFNGKTQSTSV